MPPPANDEDRASTGGVASPQIGDSSWRDGLGVRLTDAEAIAVEAAAARRGVPPFLFIRSAALVAATGVGGTTTPEAATEAVDRVNPDAAEIIQDRGRGRDF